MPSCQRRCPQGLGRSDETGISQDLLLSGVRVHNPGMIKRARPIQGCSIHVCLRSVTEDPSRWASLGVAGYVAKDVVMCAL